MHIHIPGICGTFMGGIALLAREAGLTVSGSDKSAYPPMSTQLEQHGIRVLEGYAPEHVDETVDCVIVGNVISRGNPLIESVMARGLPYVSGPEWLARHILATRHVLAVAGTHGKTTTTSMLVYLLDAAGLSPGFLVGGVPLQLGVSARLGSSPFFVIEADEYDTAFFDKRSKFIHYRPRTLILNNLEYDHADIFPDLAAIQQQFHWLVRTVPPNGQIVCPSSDPNLEAVLQKGCWTPRVTFGAPEGQWQARLLSADGSHFEVSVEGVPCGEVRWGLLGKHNVNNALAALAAARHAGVLPETAVSLLSGFTGVKRRLEVRGRVKGVTVYDDFAHHPTAIATTLAGLRAREGSGARILAVIEPGSHTMRMGVHRETLAASLKDADWVACRDPQGGWDLSAAFAGCQQPVVISADVDELVRAVSQVVQPGDHVIVMSNSGFGGIHEKLLAAI